MSVTRRQGRKHESADKKNPKQVAKRKLSDGDKDTAVKIGPEEEGGFAHGDEGSPSKIRKSSDSGEEDMAVSDEDQGDQVMTTEEVSLWNQQEGDRCSINEPVRVERERYTTGAETTQSQPLCNPRPKDRDPRPVAKWLSGMDVSSLRRHSIRDSRKVSESITDVSSVNSQSLTVPGYSRALHSTRRRIPVLVNHQQPTAAVATQTCEFSRRRSVTKTSLNPSAKAGGLLRWFISAVLMGLLVLLAFVLPFKSSGSSNSTAEVFGRLFADVESAFPSQRAELWRRSQIHLQSHLRAARPTEPVSLFLASGWGAERTLRCLALRLASAFSSTLNASDPLCVDGAGKATQDANQAKLELDRVLRGSFEGGGAAAVVHRFEELPPGSSLIFYRYCDHENAAYKEALLIFTALLPVEELSPKLDLMALEEMLHDHILGRFLPSAQTAAFDEMDQDKFSGLWSRISHVVLPVAAEEHFERRDSGCDL